MKAIVLALSLLAVCISTVFARGTYIQCILYSYTCMYIHVMLQQNDDNQCSSKSLCSEKPSDETLKNTCAMPTDAKFCAGNVKC